MHMIPIKKLESQPRIQIQCRFLENMDEMRHGYLRCLARTLFCGVQKNSFIVFKSAAPVGATVIYTKEKELHAQYVILVTICVHLDF